MPRKFCPLSFFSFYVNKENAQAGGAHHCVEEQCALWDEAYEQCGLKSGIEALGSIAETGYSSKSRGKNLASAVRGNVTSVFDKLRKKKSPIAGNDTSNATSAASTKTTSVASTENENQKPLVTVGAQTEQKSAQVQNNKQSQQEKNSQNNQIKLPIIPKLDGITSPFSEKQTQQQQTQPTQQQQTSQQTQPTQQQQTSQQTQQTQQQQTSQQTQQQQTQQPQQESKKEDYSDLLNPPAVPVSELPIISKTDASKVIETESQKSKPIEATQQPQTAAQPDSSPPQTQPTTNQPTTQQQPSSQQQSEQTQAEPKKEENK